MAIIDNRGYRNTPFELYGNGVHFAPFFYPTRVVVTKEQKLARDGNPCAGEDVDNIGSKNREIHIVGLVRQNERYALEQVLDQTDDMNLISLSWSGEVVIENGEYEGPIGQDAHTNEYLWEYTIDLVSTGEDEAHHSHDSGIISPARELNTTGSGGSGLVE